MSDSVLRTDKSNISEALRGMDRICTDCEYAFFAVEAPSQWGSDGKTAIIFKCQQAAIEEPPVDCNKYIALGALD